MVPSPHKAVVVLDHVISPVQLRANRGDTVSGIIDYTTFVAASDAKGALSGIRSPALVQLDSQLICGSTHFR